MKFFEKIYNKNKTLMALVFFGLLVFFGWASGLILSSTGTLSKHEIRIETNEKSIDYLEGITSSIVTRASFNAYIKRKDDELMRQMEFNQDIAHQIGYLSGQLYVTVEKIKKSSGKPSTQEVK